MQSIQLAALFLLLAAGCHALPAIDETTTAASPQAVHEPATSAPQDASPPTSAPAASPFPPPGYDYCHASKPEASTYKPLPNAKLVLVQLVTRHGDRTSASGVVPNDTTDWNCKGSRQVQGIRTGKGTVVPPLLVDTEISPKSPFAPSLWKGSCFEGQLTPKGVQQHLQLGGALRDIYVKQLKFLSPVLNAKEVSARSTQRDRCVQSAISLMGGMYPQTKRGPTASKTPLRLRVTILEWDELRSHEDRCPKLKSLMGAMLKEPAAVELMKKEAGLRATLNKIMDTAQVPAFASKPTLVPAQDNLLTHKCHGLPLFCNRDKSECVTDEMLHQVQSFVHEEQKLLLAGLPQSAQVNSLGYGPAIEQFRDEIVGKVGQGGKSTVPYKFSLYSAHDNTLHGVLANYGAGPDALAWAPYASNLLTELWQRDSGMVVRIIYNGKPLQSTKCDFANGCPLDKYLSIADQVIPKNYALDCSLDGKPIDFGLGSKGSGL